MATYQEPVGEVVPLHGTTIETGGALLPQSAMLDLVTRVKRKNGEGRHGHIDKKLRGTYLSGMGHFMAAEYWVSIGLYGWPIPSHGDSTRPGGIL